MEDLTKKIAALKMNDRIVYRKITLSPFEQPAVEARVVEVDPTRTLIKLYPRMDRDDDYTFEQSMNNKKAVWMEMKTIQILTVLPASESEWRCNKCSKDLPNAGLCAQCLRNMVEGWFHEYEKRIDHDGINQVKNDLSTLRQQHEIFRTQVLTKLGLQG